MSPTPTPPTDAYVIRGSNAGLLYCLALIILGVIFIHQTLWGIFLCILGLGYAIPKIIKDRDTLRIDHSGIHVSELWDSYTILWEDIESCHFSYYYWLGSSNSHNLLRYIYPQPILEIDQSQQQRRRKIVRGIIWLGWENFIYHKSELITAIKHYGGQQIYNDAKASYALKRRNRRIRITTIILTSIAILLIVLIISGSATA